MAAPLRSAAAAAAAFSSAATTTAAAASSGGFVPRAVFEVSASLPRSYFLGHHAGALTSMRKILSNVGLIVECRDMRVPLTSTNPLLEAALASRERHRIIAFTKADLSVRSLSAPEARAPKRLLKKFHTSRDGSEGGERGGGEEGEGGGRIRGGEGSGAFGSTHVVFTHEQSTSSIEKLIEKMKEVAVAGESLTGLRALVVGMPNAGKSTLLNLLRRVGMDATHRKGRDASSPSGSEPARKLAKVAETGATPGVTRKLSTPVRVAAEDAEAGLDGGVFVIDAPGVFVPYMQDVEAMLKLALVGSVKDGVVPAETVADYLLFRLNLQDPALYGEFSPPTNDVQEFLDGVARRTGKLLKGGVPSREQAADWIVQQWRKGKLGRFMLDDVSEEGLKAWSARMLGGGGEERVSLHQARKREKEARKERQAAKRRAAEGI